MGKIDELIEELCPEGVPYHSLPTLAKIDRGLTYQKSDEDPNGSIAVLRSNNIDQASNTVSLVDTKRLRSDLKPNPKTRLVEGDILISAASGSRSHVGKVAYISIDPDAYFGGFMMAIRAGELIQGRYLFHILTSSSFRDYLDQSLSSSTINNINSAVLEGFNLPLPPLEVQREIVSILDKFTQLEAELEAELEARRIQYEVTRDKLLDFSDALATHPMSEVIRELCPEGVPFHRLDELFDVRGGFTPSKSEAKFWSMGTIPWFRMEDIREGGRILNSAAQMVSSSAAKSGGAFEADSIIISTSATIGEHALVTVPFLANQRFSVLTRKREFRDAIDPKYAFYIGFKLSEYCKENTSVSSFAGVVMSSFKAFQFPLPPIEIQTEIVSILDKLDALVNDITIGLPAEIEARRKQYEHYRNRLLTFKELEAA